ncbi:NADH dehydrogenase subunit 5 [Alicyclobacillus herbarius]|uniref:NADH dehydrogenase subunit 5 n=1 Tax=Alicyclobacillus herbarius TaxID=122960 RepID=UPI0004074BEC|nr:NADH dehydrogenase subunit 5 [Alicyclobacillus herbarius]
MQQAVLVAWLGAWAVVLTSAMVLVSPRVPQRWVNPHVRLLWLPVAVSLAGVSATDSATVWGPWRADRLGWFMALYISLLSVIIQTFSVRYLHGDRAYRGYFAGLTWVTGAATVTWMSDNLAVFACGWTLMGACLTALVALKREWAPARAVAVLCAKRFLLSAAAVGTAALWLGIVSGSWRMSIALAHAPQIALWERVGISGLLILAALIQAGGWPFQRWLMESAVTPTPVSAVMHAGLVNAGGLLLTRTAPLFDRSGMGPHVALLVLAWVSVLLGTGILLVHVDYKRQLVASTMAQMGLMLCQCALGAYDAAVVHLVLHGFFKATLFLRSGSVVPRPQRRTAASAARPGSWLVFGFVLAVVLGGAYWAIAPGEPARLLSALFLGAGAMLGWRQLFAVREGRWLGVGAIILAVLAAEGVRTWLTGFVRDALSTAWAPPDALPVFAFLLFAGGALGFALLSARPGSRAFARLYMWLVHFGEPRLEAMEPHPRYLATYVKEGSL